MHSYCEGPQRHPVEGLHINVDLSLLGKKNRLWVDKWWGYRKQLATICTVCNHVQNMINGGDLVV